jgi:hypothetical protein
MSRKHNKEPSQERQIRVRDYTKSKHTKNNYLDSIKKFTREELFKEYNKLQLLLNMMRVGHMKGLSPYTKGQDNIQIIKWKYNVISQEITNRNFKVQQLDYRSKTRGNYKSK